MKIEITMDWDWFDNMQDNITNEQKVNIVKRFNALSEISDKLYKEGRISKITQNRVHRLWRFFPHGTSIISSKKFNELFYNRPINLVYIKNAVNKCLRIYEESSLSTGSNEVCCNKDYLKEICPKCSPKNRPNKEVFGLNDRPKPSLPKRRKE